MFARHLATLTRRAGSIGASRALPLLLVCIGLSAAPAAAQVLGAGAHWFMGSGTPITVKAVGIPLQNIASFSVPAGTWALFGTANVTLSDTLDATTRVVHKGSVSCSFAGGGAAFSVSSPSPSGTFGYSTGMMTPVSFNAALTFSGPITLTLDCNKSDAAGSVRISNVQLIAIPVGSVTRH